GGPTTTDRARGRIRGPRAAASRRRAGSHQSPGERDRQAPLGRRPPGPDAILPDPTAVRGRRRAAPGAGRRMSQESNDVLRDRLRALEAEVQQLRRQLAISERAAARGEKLQALGQLISGVAHELANPLTAVVACAAFIATAKNLEDAQLHAATI